MSDGFPPLGNQLEMIFREHITRASNRYIVYRSEAQRLLLQDDTLRGSLPSGLRLPCKCEIHPVFSYGTALGVVVGYSGWVWGWVGGLGRVGSAVG